jgi:hypothetical protein
LFKSWGTFVGFLFTVIDYGKEGKEYTSQPCHYHDFMAKTTRNNIIVQNFLSLYLKDDFVFLFRNFYRDKVAAQPVRVRGVPGV